MGVKIAIGTPTGGTIKTKTALTLVELVRTDNYEFLPIFMTGNYVAENREKIVKIAQDTHCTHLFFVDADISFNSSVISILVNHDKDIVGGMYNYRFHPLTSVVKFFNEEGKTVTSIENIPSDLFKVPALGAGCLLIKMSVFEKLQKPYFQVEQNEEGNVICTTDVAFCEQARDKGFDVWCDPTLLIKHIGDYEF